MTGVPRLVISSGLWEVLETHIDPGHEHCAFLIGHRSNDIGIASESAFIRNRSRDRHRFLISNTDLTRVLWNIDPASAIVAFFHSHGLEPAVPSAADMTSMDPSLVWTIGSRSDRNESAAFRSWLKSEGKLHEILTARMSSGCHSSSAADQQRQSGAEAGGERWERLRTRTAR
jgi:proteasome lid subunit RPN8/RPN11